MLSGSGGGGQRPNGNRNPYTFGKHFDDKRGEPSRSKTKARTPFEAFANPDELISNIPFPEQAISDLNGVPVNEPPFRDIPSSIIGRIGNPQLREVEPDWQHFLRYFSDRVYGISNLQDLYIFLTRVALPNAVIINRRTLLRFYLGHRDVSPRLSLHYDAYHWHGAPYIPLNQERPNPFAPLIQNRSIFRSAPTPNGTNMVQWLQTPISTPPPEYDPVPIQMIHRPSQLDWYLQESETEVRMVHPEHLMRRTARVFNAWWWIMQRNAVLEEYRLNGWAGIERELRGGT
ncbi:hypothetical protein P280DRAFT_468185 [Massarina eburnea CBS 473.64]|uniref:Uncharacterized protein n=1 Tax=Massarina eburnea CBS 473.64 TaxID=1395130 RepID=A0A6A6S7B0_9PLEO|nr:hypothetical protein P280DRAFT_468185 [Massarina eburnea CBS 473.64]